jgi:hypothetical protein
VVHILIVGTIEQLHKAAGNRDRTLGAVIVVAALGPSQQSEQ